jgi:membrane glycosyltransferase
VAAPLDREEVLGSRSVDAAERAVLRVANYLRTLGLSDRRRVRELSREIALQVTAEAPEQHAAAAVAAAQARFEAWREALYRDLPAGVDPLWLRAFIGARPELFLGDIERGRRAAQDFGDPRAGRAPRRAQFRPQEFELARLPRWLRGLAPPLLLTLLAAQALWSRLAADGGSVLEMCWTALFIFLFAQAAIGLSTVVLGCFSRPTRHASLDSRAALPRTALLMPIYHESAEDVFAALAGMRESLSDLPGGEAFEIFVLSDSREPGVCADEERAFRSVAASGPGVPIYYHRRAHNERQKAGNLAEFFERWAPRYEYAVTLDADSVMTGETLIELVRRMQADPKLALLQAPLALHRGETLFARAQSFAASVSGRVFTRGLSRWSGNSANYYGHNAVLRVRAFLDCCELPKLHGEPPFGGHVSSHDFVEAALLCRAGWHVRIADDLTTGSYEEVPPTLSDYVARDHRWCQGNLQHLLVARMRGLAAMSRIHLLLGAFAYLAAPAWLAFLVLGVVLGRTQGFGAAGIDFVAGTTFAVLLGPWLLGFWDTARDAARRRAHGGWLHLGLSTLLGLLLGTLLAPLLLVHHTRIVYSILTGQGVGWNAQQRQASTDLRLVLRSEMPATLLGVGVLVVGYLASGNLLLWLAPLWVPWLLSIPIDLCVSSSALGRSARRRGLLTIPSESEPEPLLSRIEQLRALTRSDGAARYRDLVLDPVLLAAHLEKLQGKRAAASPQRLSRLRARALRDGPFELSPSEWRTLAEDSESMQLLHRQAWQHWPVESWDLGREKPQLPPDTVRSSPASRGAGSAPRSDPAASSVRALGSRSVP